MFAPNGWFAAIRAILELLYFASGIVIAVAAVRALTQIAVTKQIAKKNSRRESVKLAAELCKYFAESVVSARHKAVEEYKKGGFTCLEVLVPRGQEPFVIKDGEITDPYFNLKQLGEELPYFNSAIMYLNTMEAFAIPFVAGVADEDIGYTETAIAFCLGAKHYMPVIFMLRVVNAGRFESIVKLYETWNKRVAAERSAPALKAMQELAKDAEKGRIKPLDEGF